MVGSEGTLGFVAEATFRTVPAHPYAATGLLVFAHLAAATAALPAWSRPVSPPSSCWMRPACGSARPTRGRRGIARTRGRRPRGAPGGVPGPGPPTTLAERGGGGRPLLSGLPLAPPARLSRDPASGPALWHIRKGLYAAVAGARPPGTTALLEDIAVPVDRLLPTCEALIGSSTGTGTPTA